MIVKHPITPIGAIELSPLDSATALSPPAGANLALVYVTDGDVAFREDGVDPTDASPALPASATFSATMSSVKFIQVGGAATLSEILVPAG